MQREFQKYKGDIPVGCLQAQYQLFRKDLRARMSREHDETPAAQSVAESYPDRSAINQARIASLTAL